MNHLLEKLQSSIPYIRFLGIELSIDKNGQILAKMPFQDHLVGNPALPALHGGGIAGFMEVTALASLIWTKALDDEKTAFSSLPRTINITSDYLLPGLSKDSYSQASIHRMGGRYASVHVYAWQQDFQKPIAECVAHFLIAEWKSR